MGWFGPGTHEVWGQLCKEIGGDLEENGWWKAPKVKVRAGSPRQLLARRVAGRV